MPLLLLLALLFAPPVPAACPVSARRAALATATVAGLTDLSGAALAADLDGDGDGELLLPDPEDGSRAVQAGALHLVFAGP